MSKQYYTTPKPKYGNPRTVIYGYDNGKLVSQTYHRAGLETRTAEVIMEKNGFVKDEWANKPTPMLDTETEENDGDE